MKKMRDRIHSVLKDFGEVCEVNNCLVAPGIIAKEDCEEVWNINIGSIKLSLSKGGISISSPPVCFDEEVKKALIFIFLLKEEEFFNSVESSSRVHLIPQENVKICLSVVNSVL